MSITQTPEERVRMKTIKANLAHVYCIHSKSKEEELAKREKIIALKFHLALCYLAQGDLSNAIIKGEQALAEKLAMPGMTKDNPATGPFYRLLINIYESKNVREGEPMHAAILAKNYEISLKYTSILKAMTTQVPGPDILLDAKYIDQTSRAQADETREERHELKQILVNDYYRGLGIREPEEVGFLEPSTVADLLLRLGYAFLSQPDYSNPIIHAEAGKYILLKELGDELNPGMRHAYKTLAEIYQHLPDTTAEKDKYAREIDFYQNLIQRLPTTLKI